MINKFEEKDDSQTEKTVSITKVIFSPPATIVFWSDGEKTVVKCKDTDIYDPEKGFAMAIAKKAFGNTSAYHKVFKRFLPKEKQSNKEIETKKEYRIMGNRAVITTAYNLDHNGIGVYLHWNGGRDSVEAFLKYMKLKGYRTPDTDCYGWARLCQVIGNFFGGGLSLGINTVDNLDIDNWDNGVYIIKGWDIVDRKFNHYPEQDLHELSDMLYSIDKAQPIKEQLGEEFLNAEEVSPKELKIGDQIVTIIFDSVPTKYEVIGYGNGTIAGVDMTGIPYADIYTNEYEDPASNYYNYLTDDIYRRVNKTKGVITE